MKPYEQGYRAYPGGWNPFASGTWECEAWSVGYEDAHADGLEGAGSFYGLG